MLLRERMEEIIDEQELGEIRPPADLQEKVQRYLADHPHMRWDRAVGVIAQQEAERDGPE
jgi:hypothetical protein